MVCPKLGEKLFVIFLLCCSLFLCCNSSCNLSALDCTTNNSINEWTRVFKIQWKNQALPGKENHCFLFGVLCIWPLGARRSQPKHFTTLNSRHYPYSSFRAACLCTNLDALIVQAASMNRKYRNYLLNSWIIQVKFDSLYEILYIGWSNYYLDVDSAFSTSQLICNFRWFTAQSRR